ncbi:hypothetical protein PENSPDRAFT_654616, partial [Peniophora sp. CONT]
MMQSTMTLFLALAVIATSVAAGPALEPRQCDGSALANQPCVGTGYCGDAVLGLCGQAGFQCMGTCKKIEGVYCISDSECVSALCVEGKPTVGANYGPTHCAA